MALFDFMKRKTVPPCRCPESLIVLGAGCKTCHQQYENVKQAVQNLGFNLNVEYITDTEKVINYGIMAYPAIVIDGKVTVSGKLLSVKGVEKLLLTKTL